MKNISKPALMGLAFPLSLEDEQVNLVTALTHARATAADLRKQAGEVRAKTWASFEAAVYAADDANTARVGHRLAPGAGVPNSEG